jgi:hypothetical protein
MIRNPLFCCPHLHIPTKSTNRLISTFLSALFSLAPKNPTHLFPSSHFPLPISSLTILELEIISPHANMTRTFSYHYFRPRTDGKYSSAAYREMYHEESFVEISQEAMGERWVDEQEDILEWWRREESGELGRDRMGWRCWRCGWWYWVRVVEFEDLDEI